MSRLVFIVMARYFNNKSRNDGDSDGRIKLPNRKNGELFGIVEQMTGAYRSLVTCEDKKVRICRIPGGKRKHMWIREGMLVIIKPWDLEGDKKADIVFKYPKGRDDYLRSRGYLKALDGNDEQKKEEVDEFKTEEELALEEKEESEEKTEDIVEE